VHDWQERSRTGFGPKECRAQGRNRKFRRQLSRVPGVNADRSGNHDRFLSLDIELPLTQISVQIEAFESAIFTL
jgi:hypothetical protein